MGGYNRNFDEIRDELFRQGLQKIAEDGAFRSSAMRMYQDTKNAVVRPYRETKSFVSDKYKKVRDTFNQAKRQGLDLRPVAGVYG